MAAIVAPGERIPDTLFHELIFECLPVCYVNENTVKYPLATFWVSVDIPRVQNRSNDTVPASYLQLAIAQRPFTLEKCDLPLSGFPVHKVTYPIVLQLIERRNAEDFEERGICIEYLARLICYVDALAKVLGELRQCLGIAETSKACLGRLGLLVTQCDLVRFSACALPIGRRDATEE